MWPVKHSIHMWCSGGACDWRPGSQYVLQVLDGGWGQSYVQASQVLPQHTGKSISIWNWLNAGKLERVQHKVGSSAALRFSFIANRRGTKATLKQWFPNLFRPSPRHRKCFDMPPPPLNPQYNLHSPYVCRSLHISYHIGLFSSTQNKNQFTEKCFYV